ncbi:hypothetical protein FUAX_47150 (plasmid) [Fulvitalea axinellae]|uniref:Uncharacterized protein n=1 Tax=Fulvitalea axinellae TaxID=1182444 RepID=A0AAU9CPW4_9BACT|nr:hypothetical protein FUAX_47150 [Fulvitalea axinellae]
MEKTYWVIDVRLELSPLSSVAFGDLNCIKRFIIRTFTKEEAIKRIRAICIEEYCEVKTLLNIVDYKLKRPKEDLDQFYKTAEFYEIAKEKGVAGNFYVGVDVLEMDNKMHVLSNCKLNLKR